MKKSDYIEEHRKKRKYTGNFNTSKSRSNSAKKAPGYKSGSKSPKPKILQDEEIKIKIPIPYPQNHYMLIEDEKLENSKYTNVLNQRFPPRKYVKHNLTSSRRFNRNKSNDITIKYLDPRINSKHLKNIHHNLDEYNLNYIGSLPEALNAVQKLKNKIIEYELTNNKNIELALEYIDSVESDNEFLKTKLKEAYEKLGKYSEQFGDEILNDHVYLIVNKFRIKWARIKIFRFIVSSHKKITRFNVENDKFVERRVNALKLKAFLGIQKNYLNYLFKGKMDSKRSFLTVRDCFNGLKFNLAMAKCTRKFQKVKKAISYILNFKQIKYHAEISKKFKKLYKTAYNSHFYKSASKVLLGLKLNMKYNLKYGFNHEERKFKLKFTRFLMDTNQMNCRKDIKEKKIKGLKLLKEIFIRKNLKLENKYTFINRFNLLNKFFFHWKILTINYNKNIEFIVRTIKAVTKNFIKKCQQRAVLKNESWNQCQIQYRAFFAGFKRTLNNKKVRTKVYPQIVKQKEYLRFYKNAGKFMRSRAKFKQIFSNVWRQFYFLKIKKTCFNIKTVRQLKNIANFSLRLKLSHLQEFNNKRKVFKKISHKLFYKLKVKKFREKMRTIDIYIKTLNTIRTTCLFKRILSNKKYYDNLIANLKQIIDEKSEILKILEINFDEMKFQQVSLLESNQEIRDENNFLRKKIIKLEQKIKTDSEKISEMFSKNVHDIKCKIINALALKDTLKNNEYLLSDAITREERLQNKYSTDVESLIRMNKQLNELVNKKNENIASIKNSYKNIDIENKEKISKLNKQSSEIFNDYSKYIEMKNLELKNIEQEKKKYMSESTKKLIDLEEQKIKNEYLANFLKEESKFSILDYRNRLRSLSNVGSLEREDSQRENTDKFN